MRRSTAAGRLLPAVLVPAVLVVTLLGACSAPTPTAQAPNEVSTTPAGGPSGSVDPTGSGLITGSGTVLPSGTLATPSDTESSEPHVTATPTVAPGAHQPVCGTLTLTARRGSGATQMQFASVVVTNTSSQTCWVLGYPSVTMVLGSSALGAAATNAGGNPAVQLAPGATATATVHGPTSCDAQQSDHLRVSLGAATATVAMRLRGCALAVEAFVHD